MKKIITFTFASMLFLVSSSCKKALDELTEFDINYASEVAVPSASVTPTVPVEIVTPKVATQSSSKFAAENTAKDLITEIKFTKFNISTNTGNLDFLKSFQIFLKGDNLSDVMVASKSNIPAGSTSVAADLNDVNVKEFIFKDSIQFRVSLTFGTPVTSDRQVKMEETVHTKASLLK